LKAFPGTNSNPLPAWENAELQGGNVKVILLAMLMTATLGVGLATRAAAEVVYTQVNVSIPVNGSYNIVLNPNGVADFTLSSRFLQGYCQSGDEFVWSLTVESSSGNAVVNLSAQIGSDYASALLNGVPISSSQSFNPSASVMAELYWGNCGIGALGQWLNLPDRYLGLEFQDAAGNTHYGWAKVSTVAYVDQNGHLQASTVLSGFAYQTVTGQGILTGQTS
jgi:hypothetical protein